MPQRQGAQVAGTQGAPAAVTKVMVTEVRGSILALGREGVGRVAVQETAHVERCPACGSQRVRNLIHWERGEPLHVYVACAVCDTFIARYSVERYTSSESYEGLLRLLGGHVVTSERELIRELAVMDDEVRRSFDHVQELIRRHEDPRRIEQILYEEADGDRVHGDREE